MSVNVFGVTAEMVRADFASHLGAITTSSAPSLSSVNRAINQAGARLAGLLDDKQIDTSEITDSSSAAYLYCQRYVELWVAVHALRNMSGANSELIEAWRKELDSVETAIDKQGAAALGPGATQSGTSEALGPTDWISEGNIDVGPTSEWSGVIPNLRRDDAL